MVMQCQITLTRVAAAFSLYQNRELSMQPKHRRLIHVREGDRDRDLMFNAQHSFDKKSWLYDLQNS